MLPLVVYDERTRHSRLSTFPAVAPRERSTARIPADSSDSSSATRAIGASPRSSPVPTSIAPAATTLPNPDRNSGWIRCSSQFPSSAEAHSQSGFYQGNRAGSKLEILGNCLPAGDKWIERICAGGAAALARGAQLSGGVLAPCTCFDSV